MRKAYIGKGDARKDIQKIAGTHRPVGKNIGELDLGAHEGELFKIFTNKLNANGWFVRLKDTGKTIDAFNSSPEFKILPKGNYANNIIILNPKISVLCMQSRNGDDWYILNPLKYDYRK